MKWNPVRPAYDTNHTPEISRAEPADIGAG